ESPRRPRKKNPRRFRRDEGGRFGLRVSRLKHKPVIVCEVPHICLLVERISCAVLDGETDKNTGTGHARHCHRVLKAAAALRADRHGRDAVAFRIPQTVTSDVEVSPPTPPGVIPGRTEGATPESRTIRRACLWIPGSPP